VPTDIAIAIGVWLLIVAGCALAIRSASKA